MDPSEIDAKGLLPTIQKKLQTIGVDIFIPYISSSYLECKFTFESPSSNNKIDCNYAFAWTFGIITLYNGRIAQDNFKLYSRSGSINVIGFDGSSQITNKLFFPLINGGINKMTISSDELVTSQYVNGFKTVGLAKIATNDNLISIDTIPPSDASVQNSIKAHFTIKPHEDKININAIVLPNINSPSQQLDYYPSTLPDVLTSFECPSECRSLFDFVVIKQNASNVIMAYPSNVTENGPIGELRINLPSLIEIADLWYLKLKFFATAKDRNHSTILKTNFHWLDNSGHQLHTVMCGGDQLHDPHTTNMQHPLLHLTISRLLDLDLVAAQLAIHMYCFFNYGFNGNSAFIQLTLNPLEGTPW